MGNPMTTAPAPLTSTANPVKATELAASPTLPAACAARPKANPSHANPQQPHTAVRSAHAYFPCDHDGERGKRGDRGVAGWDRVTTEGLYCESKAGRPAGDVGAAG